MLVFVPEMCANLHICCLVAAIATIVIPDRSQRWLGRGHARGLQLKMAWLEECGGRGARHGGEAGAPLGASFADVMGSPAGAVAVVFDAWRCDFALPQLPGLSINSCIGSVCAMRGWLDQAAVSVRMMRWLMDMTLYTCSN